MDGLLHGDRPAPDEGYDGGPGESLAFPHADPSATTVHECSHAMNLADTIAKLSSMELDALTDVLPDSVMRGQFTSFIVQEAY